MNWVQILTLCPFIFLASRLGCNYFVVSHETGKGLIPTQGRGHPSKQRNNAQNDEMDEIVLPNFPQDCEKEIMDLCRSLFVEDDSKVLLLVLICKAGGNAPQGLVYGSCHFISKQAEV